MLLPPLIKEANLSEQETMQDGADTIPDRMSCLVSLYRRGSVLCPEARIRTLEPRFLYVDDFMECCLEGKTSPSNSHCTQI